MGLGPSYPPGAIVVSASIGGTPFVEGHLVYISGGKLKSITNSLLDSPGTVGESVVLGGAGVDSVQIGRGARADGALSICIGTEANYATPTITGVVVVGRQALAQSANNVAVGTNANASGVTAVAVGANSTASTRSTSLGNAVVGRGPDFVGVGQGQSGNVAGSATKNIVIGNTYAFAAGVMTNTIFIGHAPTSVAVTRDSVLVIGHGLTDTPASNTGYIGTQGMPLDTIWFGYGASGASRGALNLRMTARASGGQGNDLQIWAQDGSVGNRPGAVVFRGTNGAGSVLSYFRAGQTGNLLTELQLNSIDANNDVYFAPLGTSGMARMGVVGVAGRLIDDSAAGDVVVVAYSDKHLRLAVSTTASGDAAVTAIDISAADIVLDARTGNLRFNNFTNGAGAAVGTLNNAPTAGDPTEWMRVSYNGNIRYIPMWP